MFLSKCAVFNSKKSKFFKEQAKELLTSLTGLRALLNQISLLGPLLF